MQGCIDGSWSTWCPPGPPGPICKAAFQPVRPQPVLCMGLFLTRAGLGVSLCRPSWGSPQPVSPAWSPAYWLLSCFDIIWERAKSTLIPLTQSLSKDTKQYWPQYGSLRDSMGKWLPFGLCTHDHHPWSLTVQMIFHPGSCPSFSPPLTTFFINSISSRRYGIRQDLK